MTTYRAAAVVVILATASVATVACQGQAQVERPDLRVGSAFGPFSEPLAEEYRTGLPGMDVSIAQAPDSQAVVEGIEAGAIDVGIAFADVVYSAYRSREAEEAVPSALRGVMLLQPLPQYLLAAGGSGITSVSDLQGRTLAVRGASHRGPLLLEAFGVQATIRSVPSREEAVRLLKDGEADAILLAGYTYPDEVMHPAIESGAYFVPIEGPPVDRLRLERPFIRRTSIPRGIVPGQDRIIPTVGIDLLVVCRRDLPDSVVQALTAVLMDAYPRLSGVEANLRFLNPDEAPATPIPLHPGAARYFRERELSR